MENSTDNLQEKNQNNINSSTQESSSFVAPAANQPTKSIETSTAMRNVEKISAWILIISGVIFALIAILAIWGMFKNNVDTAWRSIGSIGVIALAALVINVGARIYDNKK